MDKIFLFLFMFVSLKLNAHIPALLMPLEGPPVASYFLSQSDVSRAVYSELTQSEDIFVVQLEVKPGDVTVLQLLTPVCPDLPQYEAFQPTSFIIEGDLPWMHEGEPKVDYIKRLLKNAVAVAESEFAIGNRPQFHEEYANVDYWVGGEWRGQLKPGLHTVVVYSPDSNKGVFSLGLNEKEAWNEDLFAYANKIVPIIKKGLCDPHGFSGKLTF